MVHTWKNRHVYSKKSIAVLTFLLQTPQPILNSLLSVVYVDVVGAIVVILVGVTEATPSNDSSYRKPIESKQKWTGHLQIEPRHDLLTAFIG